MSSASTYLLDLPVLLSGLKEHLQLVALAQLWVRCLRQTRTTVTATATALWTLPTKLTACLTRWLSWLCVDRTRFWHMQWPAYVLLQNILSRLLPTNPSGHSRAPRWHMSNKVAYHAVYEHVECLLPLYDELCRRLILLHHVLFRDRRHDDACQAGENQLSGRHRPHAGTPLLRCLE